MAQFPNSFSPDNLLKPAEDYSRQYPARAVATAFGFGFLLQLLPLGTLAAMLASLLFALIRPILLVLGVWKAFDIAHDRSS